MAFRSNRRRLGAKPGFLQIASHPCNTNDPRKGSTTARREWRSRAMRTGAAVPAAEPRSATGGRGSNNTPREGVLPQLLPDILSGRTSWRGRRAQRLGAMQCKRQCICSELPASISGKPRGRSALSQPHACKAKNGFTYVTNSRLESSIASKSSAPRKTKANVARRISSNR